MAAILSLESPRAEYEPEWQLLGQWANRDCTYEFFPNGALKGECKFVSGVGTETASGTWSVDPTSRLCFNWSQGMGWNSRCESIEKSGGKHIFIGARERPPC